MRLTRRKVAVAVALLLAAGLAVFFFVVPPVAERILNNVGHAPPYEASARARELHRLLLVADMHADSLLWGRDLLARATRGHADVPRLVEGNVALQVFATVTKTPRGLNIERNEGDSDNIIFAALAQRWPARTWRSLKERALYQATRLRRTAERSQGKLVVVETKGDLARHLERRAREPEAGLVAALLAVEGAHALEGDPSNVEALYAAGFRMMSPAHFFDNEMAGSAHGTAKGGLTGAGREMVRRMEARGMTVDLAHSSARTFDDVLAMATRPVVVSHTGVRGTCDNARNLSDGQLRGVARTGGLVGVGYWPTATCGEDARSIARAVRHAAGVVGVEHVALGSDFDGAVAVPFDTSGLAQLTDALIAEGFADEDIAKIMGGNFLRLLSETLPD
ncbi:MAG TPA: dipeptidase [Pyrinomonadaceae bacterium]|nr:dipeptidase [Pyrinomonadaceae bacterium]